jgi:Lon protease-like protein
MPSSVIPMFPLPNVVLFPNVFLPLHIFEPRYREMVGDALEGDRIIGMVLLKEGWEIDDEGRPPVYAIGCSGVITHAERLGDGRYNIVLRGLEKFRILTEDARRSYRIAEIESVAELSTDGDRARLRAARPTLDTLLRRRLQTAEGQAATTRQMSDEDFVNALAQYLDFDPIEKQALLECGGLVDRCHALIELLEMKAIADECRCSFLPRA